MTSEDLVDKIIKVLKAEYGACDANNRIGTVLSIQGRGRSNDLLIQMQDNGSIWNIGDVNKVKYKFVKQ